MTQKSKLRNKKCFIRLSVESFVEVAVSAPCCKPLVSDRSIRTLCPSFLDWEEKKVKGERKERERKIKMKIKRERHNQKEKREKERKTL